MIYLTFGDTYTGVYQSQVIEVCDYLSSISKPQVRLIAIVPYPQRKLQKDLLKKQYPKTIVLPMLPAHLHLWKLFIPLVALLFLFLKSRKVICRGGIACNIGLNLRKIGIINKVIFDGRGSQTEEWKEYDIVGNQKINGQIFSIEKKAVLQSDNRISVSQELINHWQKEFGYSQGNEVVIPCTLAKSFLNETGINKEEIRKKYNFLPDDIVLVYSGSSSGWQSFQLLNKWLEGVLFSNEQIKILFLSKKEAVEQLSIYSTYKNRIAIDWLKPDEVFEVLNACDYGILYRGMSITNQVASPTKFAEYLAAGLRILISDGIGDYSKLVKEKGLGEVIAAGITLELKAVNDLEKKELHDFAILNFTKQSYENQYKILIDES